MYIVGAHFIIIIIIEFNQSSSDKITASDKYAIFILMNKQMSTMTIH